MERNEKRDLYRTGLKRTDAFVVFMAAGEADLSLLPEPITKTERQLMKLCEEKAKEVEILGFTVPEGDAEGNAGTGESMNAPDNVDDSDMKGSTPAPEEKTVKKPAVKRTTTKKKAADK